MCPFHGLPFCQMLCKLLTVTHIYILFFADVAYGWIFLITWLYYIHRADCIMIARCTNCPLWSDQCYPNADIHYHIIDITKVLHGNVIFHVCVTNSAARRGQLTPAYVVGDVQRGFTLPIMSTTVNKDFVREHFIHVGSLTMTTVVAKRVKSISDVRTWYWSQIIQ